MSGFIRNNMLDPETLKERHDLLAEEMLSRGFRHSSPFIQPDISYLSEDIKSKKRDEGMALKDLLGRCDRCRERWNSMKSSPLGGTADAQG